MCTSTPPRSGSFDCASRTRYWNISSLYAVIASNGSWTLTRKQPITVNRVPTTSCARARHLVAFGSEARPARVVFCLQCIDMVDPMSRCCQAYRGSSRGIGSSRRYRSSRICVLEWHRWMASPPGHLSSWETRSPSCSALGPSHSAPSALMSDCCHRSIATDLV